MKGEQIYKPHRKRWGHSEAGTEYLLYGVDYSSNISPLTSPDHEKPVNHRHSCADVHRSAGMACGMSNQGMSLGEGVLGSVDGLVPLCGWKIQVHSMTSSLMGVLQEKFHSSL